jgi:hypothetical protein
MLPARSLTVAIIEVPIEMDAPSDQELLDLMAVVGAGAAAIPFMWRGWAVPSVEKFIAAGVDPYFANKVRDWTGSSDAARIVQASKLRLPAHWA